MGRIKCLSLTPSSVVVALVSDAAHLYRVNCGAQVRTSTDLDLVLLTQGTISYGCDSGLILVGSLRVATS